MAQKVLDELHNTPEEIGRWLSDALGLCQRAYDGAPIPDAVLVKVLELLASRTVNYMVAQPQTIDPNLARTLGLGGRNH